MPVFSYKARDAEGAPFSGGVSADDRQAAIRLLMGRGLTPTYLDAEGGTAPSPLTHLRERLRPVPAEEIILFTSRLAVLFRAGIPLADAISTLAGQAEDRRLRHALDGARRAVGDGAALHEALARHPALFSETYVSMVMAGEVSGSLDDALDRLVLLLERNEETRRRIDEATRYPRMVVAVLLLAVTVLLTMVLPRFAGLFLQAHIALPFPTRMLLAASAAALRFWWLFALAAGGGAVVFFRHTATAGGRLWWHRTLLRVPLFGDIYLKSALERFCGVLAGLVRSGVPILHGIEVAARAAGNDHLKNLFADVQESVRAGRGISAPLAAHELIPPMVGRMIEAGETSGALDAMLGKVADFYRQETTRNVRMLSSLIEPALVVALAGVVLFVALAIFLPMWEMARLARPGG